MYVCVYINQVITLINLNTIPAYINTILYFIVKQNNRQLLHK